MACAQKFAVCGLSCSMACRILVSLPEIELMSPALEGGFLTTGPPERSLIFVYFVCEYSEKKEVHPWFICLYDF